MRNDPKSKALAAQLAPAGRAEPTQSEFTRRVLIVAAVAVAAGAAVALFVLASDIVFLFFAAVLLAILLRAAGDALARWTGLGPMWSLGLVVVTLAVVLAAGMYAVGSMVVTQFNDLVADLPKSADQARAYVRQYPWGEAALRRMPEVGDLFSGSFNPASRAAQAVPEAAPSEMISTDRFRSKPQASAWRPASISARSSSASFSASNVQKSEAGRRGWLRTKPRNSSFVIKSSRMNRRRPV